MNHIGENHPENAFSARGRVNGKSADQLRAQGLDANGHPASSQVNGHSRPQGPGGSRGQSLTQLVDSIGDMELASISDLYTFCEAYRKLGYFLAMSAKMAEGQLRAAARAQAKDAKNGWMTPAQRLKLEHTLRQVGKDIGVIAESGAQMAVGAVKAYRRTESMLSELEDSGGRTVNRPRGGSKGFSLDWN